MSDTSGFGGFGPATRDIRRGFEVVFGPAIRDTAGKFKKVKFGPADRKSTKSMKVEAPAAGAGPIVQTLVWQKLDSDDFEQVVLPPEILYYLEAMARFIDGAKRGGLAAVVDEFGLREESNFPSLRRLISSHAPGNADSEDEGSEQHSRAGGAFNAGSARWAQEISAMTDPTQIAIRRLVDEIRSDDRYDEALLLSARLILQEYGERVIRALIREDDPWAATATRRLIDDFHAQLNDFFARHRSATVWNSKRIATTLERFPAFLRD